jgi:O-antigen biosynthesis protein WbqP
MRGKRVFDVAAAAVGLIAASPVLFALAIAVRLTSNGPALFRQTRLGRHETPFVCLKLRTMHVGTPSVPTHEAPAGSLTALGAFLRRSKLDELPQLWNVLRGDMSLVGPRPCLLHQHKLVAERRQRGVFALRPGVTGLAQVSGVDMSDPVRCAEFDARYMASMGLKSDCEILFRTFVRSRASG